MFHFYQSGSQNRNQGAITEREQASITTLREAFGQNQTIAPQGMPNNAPSIPTSDMWRSEVSHSVINERPVPLTSFVEDMNLPDEPFTMHGDMDFVGTNRTPAKPPIVERGCARTPSHLAPVGHVLEEHHMWENCIQGRKGRHGGRAINPEHCDESMKYKMGGDREDGQPMGNAPNAVG